VHAAEIVEEKVVRKSIARASAVAGIAALGMGLVAAPAAALAPSSRSCPSSSTCSTTATNFPGGTISIDVSSGILLGAGVNYIARYSLKGPNGYTCGGSFYADRVTRSFVCRNAPRGTYTGYVYGGPPTAVGVRW
jgi:hypothetical protein